MSRIVTHRGAPTRLESVVRQALPSLSRRIARRLIDDGEVMLNARTAAKGTMVRAGDEVTVPTLAPLAGEPTLPVRIVHADPGLIVLDKPAPMPTLPLESGERGTLAGFVVGIHPECAAIGAPLCAGVAHRLDTATSGLVLVARSHVLWSELRAAFRQRLVRKRYLAIVAGRPRPGTIDLALAHDPTDRRRMVPARPGLRSWPAQTHVRCLRSWAHHTLICAVIRTGVTHQIRAHLAALGTPVVGDLLYGGRPHPTVANRHALHASEIVLPPMEAHAGGRWRAALPHELQALLRALEFPVTPGRPDARS